MVCPANHRLFRVEAPTWAASDLAQLCQAGGGEENGVRVRGMSSVGVGMEYGGGEVEGVRGGGWFVVRDLCVWRGGIFIGRKRVGGLVRFGKTDYDHVEVSLGGGGDSSNCTQGDDGGFVEEECYL